MSPLHEKQFDKEASDPLIRLLNKAVILIVKFLAVLMVFVILLATLDVVVHLYQQIVSVSAFNVEGLINTLGYFIAVLIGIEIFLNIVFYLKTDAIHVPLVLSTALTAVARKIIILDYKAATPLILIALAAIIFSLGLTYWLITKKN